jgi:hypothetical protein
MKQKKETPQTCDSSHFACGEAADHTFRIARFLFGRRKGSASTKIQSGPEVPL